jgi:hypothetical protein
VSSREAQREIQDEAVGDIHGEWRGGSVLQAGADLAQQGAIEPFPL